MNEDTEQKIRRMEKMVEIAKMVIGQLCEVLQNAEVGVNMMRTLEDKYGWYNVDWGRGIVNDGMARIGVALADMLKEYDCMCGRLEQAKGGAK